MESSPPPPLLLPGSIYIFLLNDRGVTLEPRRVDEGGLHVSSTFKVLIGRSVRVRKGQRSRTNLSVSKERRAKSVFNHSATEFQKCLASKAFTMAPEGFVIFL